VPGLALNLLRRPHLVLTTVTGLIFREIEQELPVMMNSNRSLKMKMAYQTFNWKIWLE